MLSYSCRSNVHSCRVTSDKARGLLQGISPNGRPSCPCRKRGWIPFAAPDAGSGSGQPQTGPAASVQAEPEAPLAAANGSSNVADIPTVTPEEQQASAKASTPPAASLAPGDAEKPIIGLSGNGVPWPEINQLMVLAVPLAVQNVIGFSLSIISQAFAGQLGAHSLSAVVLASSFFNVTGLSIALGLSAGLDTLCGQAYGAQHYKLLGLYLQRGVLVCWAACLPIAWFMLDTQPALLWLGQHVEIAADAAMYMRAIIPSLFLVSLQECLRKYLVTQGVVRPAMILTGLEVLMAPFFNWYFIYGCNMGLAGAAAALNASHATGCLALLVYVALRASGYFLEEGGKARQTWPGFSLSALRGWGTYLRYGLPSAIMICVEWWAFEVIVLGAGLLPNAQEALSVMGISMATTSWTYMLPLGLASALNTSISNALGAGDPARAARLTRAGITMAVVLQALVVLAVMLGGRGIAWLFCRDEAVIQLTLTVIPIVAIMCFCDGLNANLAAVLRGSGRQIMGAAINIAGYWGVGVPLAVALAFKAGLGVIGFELGIGVAGMLQAIIFGFIVSRWNWAAEVARAKVLIAQQASFAH